MGQEDREYPPGRSDLRNLSQTAVALSRKNLLRSVQSIMNYTDRTRFFIYSASHPLDGQRFFC